MNTESPESGKWRKINKQKSLAKNQVCAIIIIRDIRKKVLPKFIRLCMETPCWCPFEGHKYGRRKPRETSGFEFSYLCVNSSLEDLMKIKLIFDLRKGMCRWHNLKKICNVFNSQKGFPGPQLQSLRTADVLPVVASLPLFGRREATTYNTSAVHRLPATLPAKC